jgi:hypothetical protein
MGGRGLAGSVAALLAKQANTFFADFVAWQAHLVRLAIAARAPGDESQLHAIQDLYGWPARVRCGADLAVLQRPERLPHRPDAPSPDGTAVRFDRIFNR